MEFSLATLLVSVCIGVVAMVIVVPLVHRLARPTARSNPQLRAWDDPTRPARCFRCGTGELVHLRGAQITIELPQDDEMLRLPAGRQRQAVDLEMLVCARCGRAEWFAASPRALEPHQKAAPPVPYRD